MSAAFTLDPSPGFPAGTTVELHPESAFPGGTSTPVGAALATATTGTDGRTAFTGLDYNRDYWAFAPSTGRRVRFHTDDDPDRPELEPMAARLLSVERGSLAGIESVTAHGALGDGTTDDTTAIQAAIDAAGGGIVLFPKPPVHYKITAALIIRRANAGLTLKGTGWWGICAIRQYTTGVPVITTEADNTHSVVIEDLTLNYATQSVTGDTQAYGIMFTCPSGTLSGMYNWEIRRVLIEGAKIGIGAFMASGALPVWGMTFDHVYLRKIATSLIDLSTFTTAGMPINKFRHIQSIGNTVTPDGVALKLRGEWVMDGLDIEDWTNRVLFSGGGRHCSLRGYHIERLNIVESATRTFELQDATYTIESGLVHVATASASSHSLFIGNAGSKLMVTGISVSWDPTGTVTYDIIGGGSNALAWLNGVLTGGTNPAKIRNWAPTTGDPAMVEFEGRPPAVTALPTSSATYRGRIMRLQGGVGVLDQLLVCRKKADDTYEWFAFA